MPRKSTAKTSAAAQKRSTQALLEFVMQVVATDLAE